MKLVLTFACLTTFTFVMFGFVRHASTATEGVRNGQRPEVSQYPTKVVVGNDVAERARALRMRNKGIARAMRDLEKKGFRPAFDHGISLLSKSNNATSQLRHNTIRKASLQSETYSSDGYEMTLISYDDGNPNTWEGIIYERNPDGLEYEYTASIDISGAQESWDRVVETYYPSDGSTPLPSNDPRYYDPNYQPYDPRLDQQLITKRPAHKHAEVQFTKVAFASQPQFPGPRYPVPDHWRDRTRRWLRCTAGGCTVSAIGCIASGAAWPACFAWWCAGSGAGCVIATW